MFMGITIEASASVQGPTVVSSGSTVYLPSSDGVCSLYTVDGTVTFKAVESGTIPNYKDFGVAFQPANEGEQIVITVNAIDISGGTRLIMYDGDVDYSKIGTSGAGGASPFTYFPAGWVKEITASDVNYTFTSTTDNGMVAFGCTTRGTTGMTGWDITVTSVSPKDMEYVSTSAVTGLPSTWRGAKNQEIFGVDIVTDGGGNPLILNELVIGASTLAGSTQVTNVRLVTGSTVLATAATVGDVLTATDVTLKSGHNRMMVVADVLPDASGTIPSLTIQSVKVADEARTATGATGDAVTIENTILMGSEATTYTIGDNVAFYDDGGKDATITQGFEGQVTFVPATPGQAIKVDFTKLELFNTSSVGYNDVFKFYNGREVNEENLIATLLDEAELVKSTAEDGSMTVYLKSTAGYPKAGWEATVSQFLPGDMTFNAVTGEAASTATVAAGDHDVQMLVVDVMTDNTSNALHLTGINLNLADAKNVAKARAYYLGKKNTFATTDQFGEVDVTGTAIALMGDKELVEGHNYVAIVLDLNEVAQNGEQVILSLQDVTVGGAAQTPAEAVSATRTVDNICHATKGSHSHNISGEWKFTHTESTLTPGKYEYDNADYIVTFTPTIENTVAEIDFSKFDVYYSGSSYGTKAVFEIYSGTSVNSENLLWSLSDASQANVGPGKVLRSTSADGSLTIRFNPKTTSSYYAATGWMATVRPFLNHDMTVNEVTVNQTSSAILAVGSTDAALIDFNVETEGTLTTKTLTGVKLNLTGVEAIDKVKVLYSGAESTLDNAVEFGNAQPTGDALVITGEKALAEGVNHFWVLVDVKQDADAEVAIDASLVELQFADGSQAVANGNPDGNRVTKAMLIMQPGVNVVTITKPIRFYDDGGPDENFSAGFDGTITFVPGVENCGIEINAIQFGTGSSSYNKFNVYNGREVNDAALVTTNGTSSPYYATYGPDHLISRAEDGTMTIHFTTSNSSYASQTSGWEIEVYLHEYKALTLDSIKAGAAIDEQVVRGSHDAVISRVALVVAHDNDKVSINDIKFNATGIDNIAAAKLYYTGKADGFATNDLFATADVADEMMFTAQNPIEMNESGTYYLWLAYDLKDEAVPGEKVGANFVSLSGGVDTTVVEASMAEREICAGFHGTYTIGASDEADYPTFAAAIQAMSVGVDGPVRFEVEDGTYAENLTIENIAGTSAEHNIVFTAKSGNRDNVIVKGTGVVESVPGSSYYKKGMVYVVNTAHLTLENMSLIPSNQSYPNAIQASDRCHYFTVRGCYIKAEPATSGISLIRTESGSENNQGNDYVTIEDNTMDGGNIAMYIYGPSKVAYSDQRGLIIRNNVVSEAGSKGVYVTDTEDAVIDGNVITQTATTKNGYQGMDLYRLTGAFVVSNNVVVNSQSTYSTGIYFREKGGSSDSQNPALVYNNAIAITNAPNNNAAGLQINSQLSNVHVYYNTVAVNGSAGYCYYNGGNDATYNGVKLQNNLFQNFTTGGLGVALFFSEDNVKKTQMLNNVFYNASSDVMVKDYAADITALNTLVGSETNTVEQAQFLSNDDLHLRAQGNLCSALPVDFITVDADGMERNAETPTVGAYEYVELSEETPEIVEGYPQVANITEAGASVKTMWTVSGKLYSQVVKATEPEQGNAAPRKAPSAEDLKVGTPQSVMAGKEATTTFDGLDENTKYEAYFLNVSALGNESEVVKAEFTTARHIEPLTATLTGASIEAGDEATLTPVIAGGDEPYTYEWTDQMNNNLGNEATVTVQPEYTWGYKVKVTSADGQTATAKAGVIVRGEQVVATMDDNYLAEKSHDEAFDLENDVYFSGSFAFNQGAMPSYKYWYGYALSSETSTEFNNYGQDDWRNVVGAAHSGSNYTVAYPEGLTVEVTNDAQGDSVMGMYVTNTPVAYKSMVTGDGFSEPFKAGSYFTLTVTGTAADGSSKNVDFNLGDYRAAEANRYVLDTWEWVDLRPLGKVTRLMFTFSGSESNNYGLVTPKYFAMDDLGCMPDVTVATVDVPLGEFSVDLSGYFAHADNGARERYYLDEEVDNDIVAVTKDGDDNVLSINGKQQGEHTVLVRMTAKGHTQWLQLTINVNPATAVSGIDAGREIQSVHYVNAMGLVSDRPFDGVNIVVTRYTDGAVTTAKIMKN